jgi:hypothetical protein
MVYKGRREGTYYLTFADLNGVDRLAVAVNNRGCEGYNIVSHCSTELHKTFSYSVESVDYDLPEYSLYWLRKDASVKFPSRPHRGTVVHPAVQMVTLRHKRDTHSVAGFAQPDLERVGIVPKISWRYND